MYGELVSVFTSLKGFTRDEELALFVWVPKGRPTGTATVRQTTMGYQEECPNISQGICLRRKLCILKKRER